MPSTAIVAFQVTVTGTPAQLPSFPLVNGGVLTAGDDSSATLGNSPSVDSSNGYPLSSGQSAP